MGARLVEAVLVVIFDGVSVFTIALIGQEPALRRLADDAIRKSGAQFDQLHHGEGIGGVFLPGERRYLHLRRGRMGQFVEQHEQRVPGHEFRDDLTILRRKTFNRGFFERERGRVIRLKRSRLRRSRLWKTGPAMNMTAERRRKRNIWSPEQARSHVSASWSDGRRQLPPSREEILPLRATCGDRPRLGDFWELRKGRCRFSKSPGGSGWCRHEGDAPIPSPAFLCGYPCPSLNVSFSFARYGACLLAAQNPSGRRYRCQRNPSGTSRGFGPNASRRHLLQGGVAIGTLALGQHSVVGQSAGAHVHMPEIGLANVPVVPAMDQPLVEPEVRRSANGVLAPRLRCAYAYRDIGGLRLYMRCYEGGPAPTLRMKPGETLKIRLINDLPPNRDILPAAHRIRTSSTTPTSISTARTAARAASPTTSCGSMAPGKSYDVEIALPADHTRGTYWYHPHHHGSCRYPGCERHGGRHRGRRRLRRRAGDRAGARACHVADAGRVRRLQHDRGLRHAVSGNLDALPGDQRPAAAHHRHAAGRSAALAPGRSQYQDNMLLELDKHELNVIAYDGIQLGACRR